MKDEDRCLLILGCALLTILMILELCQLNYKTNQLDQRSEELIVQVSEDSVPELTTELDLTGSDVELELSKEVNEPELHKERMLYMEKIFIEKEIMGVKKVNNCPDTVGFGDIIVVNVVDGELWFYGNYGTDFRKADEVARTIGGIEMCAVEVGE